MAAPLLEEVFKRSGVPTHTFVEPHGIGAMVADAFQVTAAGAEGLGNLPPELTVLV